jgi:hypothetical protein
MSKTKMAFVWYHGEQSDADHIELRLVPIKSGGYQLRVNQHGAGFYPSAEGAVADCSAGHVSIVITPLNSERALHLVTTEGLGVPSDLAEWTQYELEPQEIAP